MKMRDPFLLMTFPQAAAHFEFLTERIFMAVRSFSESMLAYELKARGIAFVTDAEPDRPTMEGIVAIIRDKLNEQRIVLTEGDLEYAYERFKHLIWLDEVVRQGIYVCKVDDEGAYYEVVNPVRKQMYTPRADFVAPDIAGLVYSSYVESRKLL